MTASAAATGMPGLCSSYASIRRLTTAKRKNMSFPKFVIQNPARISTTKHLDSLHVHASGPQREEDDSSFGSKTKDSAFTSKEDLSYLWKLGAGSILGAAVIKYGSALFPEITRPKISQALIMIIIPVVVAVVLLLKQSRMEKQE